MLATISPADRSVTWIVGKNGTISRLDANGSKHPQQSGVSTDLVAGAAPSSSVCWVVGSGGTIMRTTDGEHWAAVASPTTENLMAVSSEQRWRRDSHDSEQQEFRDVRRRRDLASGVKRETPPWVSHFLGQG